MTRMKRLKHKRYNDFIFVQKLIIMMLITFIVGFYCSYTYIDTQETIRLRNIELYDDSSTPTFKDVITEIF